MTGWIVCTLWLALPVITTGISDTFIGGTPHFQEIFIGRCWEYQMVNADEFEK